MSALIKEEKEPQFKCRPERRERKDRHKFTAKLLYVGSCAEMTVYCLMTKQSKLFHVSLSSASEDGQSLQHFTRCLSCPKS